MSDAVLREEASTVSHRLLDIDQQGTMYKEPIWYQEQKEKAPGYRKKRPFSALNIQDRPEPRSTAGVTPFTLVLLHHISLPVPVPAYSGHGKGWAASFGRGFNSLVNPIRLC